MTSDLSAYNFPHHITPTTLRPDVVVWDDARKKLLLIELTVCFETMFEDAAQRKQAKYEELQQMLEGWVCNQHHHSRGGVTWDGE